MKRVSLFTVFLIFLIPAQAQLQAYLNLKRFFVPGEGPMVESYIQVENTSVVYKTEESGDLSCAVEIIQLLRSGEEIKAFSKYCLNGKSIGDSLITPLILQQRFAVEAGSYTYELEIRDLNEENVPVFKHEEPIVVAGLQPGKLMVSDIQLVETLKKAETQGPLTKSGYDMIPLVVNYYPADFNKLVFYAEIYNSDSLFGTDGKFALRQYIEKYESGMLADNLIKHSRESATTVVPVLTIFNIEDLASGNYNLVLEVRDRENNLVEVRKNFFQRENGIREYNPADLATVDLKQAFVSTSVPDDSLSYFISALLPVATDSELPVITKELRNADLETRQKFFYAFWQRRNPDNPQREWEKYRTEIYNTNRLFGTPIKAGYETDRGRIYLKYGPPNTITDRPNEPATYPYQVWHYYRIGNFTNRRFIFFQPDLVTNDYELLHSDLRGEIQNYRWQTMLMRRNTPGDGSIDDPINGNHRHYGGNSQELFTNPR
jgi:GWxTD domain-containing protein